MLIDLYVFIKMWLFMTARVIYNALKKVIEEIFGHVFQFLKVYYIAKIL